MLSYIITQILIKFQSLENIYKKFKFAAKNYYLAIGFYKSGEYIIFYDKI